jgi:taurine--2-oxoglutarate transaminase
MCGLTYQAHLLGCAAGLATLDVYEEDKLVENSKAMGKVLKAELEKIKARHPCVGDVRVIGLFGMVEFEKSSKSNEPIVEYGSDPDKIMAKIVGKLKEKGFSTYSHENMVAISPPLIIKEHEIKEALVIFDEVCTWVDQTYVKD